MGWKRGIVIVVFRILDGLRLVKPLMRFVGRWAPVYSQKGQCVWPYMKRRRNANVQFLAYHRVSDVCDSFLPPMSIKTFETQMTYLARHCTVLNLDEAVERIKTQDVPDHAVVVTFDDGYADNYIHAFPILRRLSIPATIFLPTDVIGTGRVLWHDQVFSALSKSKVPLIEGFPENGSRFSLETLQDRRHAQDAILRYIRSLDVSRRNHEIGRLFGLLDFSMNLESPRVYLDWSEVKAMQSHGIGFGSHTATHPILSLLSEAEAREEVLESKRLIEKNLGIRVKSFAYPSGRRQDFSETTKALLRESGYECAVTMIHGTNSVGADLFEMRRTQYQDGNPHMFGARLTYYKCIS
jgi:peptidoglycan/xylan/chitin deacetylase (PgdA/CDA1 family)